MKISVLASGSKGNVTYIEHKNTRILIDLGMSSKYVESKLKELNVNPKDIDAVLITHTHSDHVSGLKVFSKKYNFKLYATEEMYDDIIKLITRDEYIYFVEENLIKDLKIRIIKTSHDTNDSVGFIINDELVYITDTGYLNKKYYKSLDNKKAYIFESNHDVEMLMNGEYPHHVKHRINGDNGHLSNKDCAKHLVHLIGPKTKHAILFHLSEKNNTEEKALEVLNKRLKNKEKNIENIIIAKQKEKTELIEI